METMIEITTKIKYEEKEFVNMSRKFFFCGIRIIPITIYVFAFIFGFVYLFYMNKIYYGIFFISLGLILIAITMIRYYVLPARKFRSNPQFQKEATITFSEDGIHAKLEKIGETKKQWNIYNKSMEDKNNYYLFLKSSKQPVTIPKRVFTSKKQEESFRNLISQKISSGIKKI